MDSRVIKGKQHCVFDDAEEYAEYFDKGKAPPIHSNWKSAQESDWVYADDGKIVQLLKVSDIKHPNDSKNYKYAQGWVRTVVGTFIKTKDSTMDSDFSKHKDRYTFSGKKSTPAKRLRSRKTVTKRERLFATSIAAGHGAISAYKSSFGDIPDDKAKSKAVMLLKQERVMKEIEKSVMDVAKSMGIDHEYVFNNLKILCEDSDDENIVLQATKELGKAIGTLGAPQKKNVEMGIYGMVQQFSPEELEKAKRPMLESKEVEEVTG